MPVIRKYENRRLYDTEGSRYVNLVDVAEMVRGGEDVTVQDAKSGRDLTREVLLQVILEAPGGAELLPVGMLRRIIRATGDDPLQKVLRHHIATGLELLHGQLDQAEGRLAKLVDPVLPRVDPRPLRTPRRATTDGSHFHDPAREVPPPAEARPRRPRRSAAAPVAEAPSSPPPPRSSAAAPDAGGPTAGRTRRARPADADAGTPAGRPRRARPADADTPTPAPPTDDLDALRARLAALEERLKR